MPESGAEEPIVDHNMARAAFFAAVKKLYDDSGAGTHEKLIEWSQSSDKKNPLTKPWVSELLAAKKIPTEEYISRLVGALKFGGTEVGPETELQLFALRKEALQGQKAWRRTPQPENPADKYDQAVAKLAEAQAERDELEARFDSLTDRFDLQADELTKQRLQISQLSQRVDDLRQAAYAYWPAEGKRLEPSGKAAPIAFHPDGQTLAVGYLDGHVQIWDPDTARRLRTGVSSHDTSVRCLAFGGHGGDMLASGSGSDDDDSGAVLLHDSRTGLSLGDPLVESDQPILAIALSSTRNRPNGPHSLAVGDKSGRVRIWNFTDVPRGDAPFDFDAGGPVVSLAFSPGHDALVAVTEHGSVMICGHNGSAVRNGAAALGLPETLGYTEKKIAIRSLCFGSGHDVLAIGDAEGRVHLLELAVGEPLRGSHRGSADVRSAIASVAASPVSSLLAIGGATGLDTWEFGSHADPISRINRPVLSVAFRRKGELVAVGMADGSTRLHAVSKLLQQTTVPRPRSRRRRWG